MSVFLGPLKALRRDPPVVYLVLRPWQNYVGIEVGLFLAGLSLIAFDSGWPGARYAIVATPFFVGIAVVAIARLFWRHRIRIESRGIFREQGTPSSRLTEQRPASDVTLVHLRSLWQRRWHGLRPLWGVSVAFAGGDEWLLTASPDGGAERRLARAIATILQAPLFDQSIEDSLPQPPYRLQMALAPGDPADRPPPEDLDLSVLDLVPRQVIVTRRSPRRARQWFAVAAALILASGLSVFAGWLQTGLWLIFSALLAGVVSLDWAMAKQVLTFHLHELHVAHRGWLPRRRRRFAWRAVTVLGRDSLTGGMLIADDQGQLTIGEALSTTAVEWLIGKATAYLPVHP